MFSEPLSLYHGKALHRARASAANAIGYGQRMGQQPILCDRLQRSCRCERAQAPFMQKILRELAEDEIKKRNESIKRQRLASKKRITVIQRNGVSVFIHTGFRNTH